jgi:hypothetical protein
MTDRKAQKRRLERAGYRGILIGWPRRDRRGRMPAVRMAQG